VLVTIKEDDMKENKIQKAARFLADKKVKGTVQMKMAYLTERQGFTDTEVLEAINLASGGALIDSAMGE
jgi:hypothetical protein